MTWLQMGMEPAPWSRHGLPHLGLSPVPWAMAGGSGGTGVGCDVPAILAAAH